MASSMAAQVIARPPGIQKQRSEHQERAAEVLVVELFDALDTFELAVAHGDGDGGPVVAEVLRPGYRWKGRVLRPAMVKVKGYWPGRRPS